MLNVVSLENTTSNCFSCVIDDDCSNSRVGKERKALIVDVHVSTTAVRGLDATKIACVALRVVFRGRTSSCSIVTGKHLDLDGVLAW